MHDSETLIYDLSVNHPNLGGTTLRLSFHRSTLCKLKNNSCYKSSRFGFSLLHNTLLLTAALASSSAQNMMTRIVAVLNLGVVSVHVLVAKTDDISTYCFKI